MALSDEELKRIADRPSSAGTLDAGSMARELLAIRERAAPYLEDMAFGPLVQSVVYGDGAQAPKPAGVQEQPTMVVDKSYHGTFLGMPVRVDESLVPGTIQFRDAAGRVLGQVVNIATERRYSEEEIRKAVRGAVTCGGDCEMIVLRRLRVDGEAKPVCPKCGKTLASFAHLPGVWRCMNDDCDRWDVHPSEVGGATP